MSLSKMSRSVSIVTMAGLVAVPSAPMAAPVVRDGEPTPAACEALGFAPAASGGYPGSPRGRPAGGPIYSMAPPPPPSPQMALPTIPPLPVPPVANRVEKRIASPAPPQSQMVLSGARRTMETERYRGAVANAIKRVAEEPVSTFSVDVDTASYANVRRFLNDGRRPPSDAVRVEELVNYFDYGYAKPADRSSPFQSFVAVTPSPWSSERQIVQIGLQGYDMPQSKQPPLNLVFLVDTSGSMWSQDRLPLATKALNLLVDQLRPQDRVAIVAYAGSAGEVLPPTPAAERDSIMAALDRLEAGGATNGAEGLELAYRSAREMTAEGELARVILATDGDFNMGLSDPAGLEQYISRQRESGTYLSVLGFGRGTLDDATMQALAQSGNGQAAYIDTLSEARKVLVDQLSGTLFPIADDVKLQVEWNPATVAEYRLIGYETRALRREEFNNDKVDAGEITTTCMSAAEDAVHAPTVTVLPVPAMVPE